MHWSTNLLDQTSGAMKDGLIANAVIAALARSSRGLELTENDLRVLADAKKFLNMVKDGYNWMNRPNVSTESRANAFIFSAAVCSWGNRVSSPLQFESDIDSMILTLDELLSQSTNVNIEKISTLRQFFGSVFRHSIEKFRTPTRRPEIPDLS